MKYFVVSDIHSFSTDLIVSLRRAGFNKKDKNHTLIVIGDVFDRGPDTIAVYKFLTSIPKKRCILIRGNHEALYLELLDKSFPDNHDFHNHTTDTFCHIAGYNPEILDQSYWYRQKEKVEEPWKRCREAWNEIREIVKYHPITAWIKSNQWKNYFELDKYIFCHAFIPVKLKEEYALAGEIYGLYNLSGRAFEYWPDWRKAKDFEWEDATWGDPIDRYQNGLFKPESDNGKVLVVGHWHTGAFYERISNIFSYEEPIHDIWFGKDFIGIDGGVFRSSITHEYVHPQNVLVIDSNDFSACYDKYGIKLEPVKTVRRIETVTPGDEEN